jgi:hypothetical protein
MDPRLELPASIVLGLLEGAEAGIRAAALAGRRLFPRRRRGLALHPGENTPLWNLLVNRANRHLKVRGSKNQLARLLGVPRQRIFDCLKARKACLDAERTLMLLGWVAGREQGKNFNANVLPPPSEGEFAPLPRYARRRASSARQ